MPNFGTKNAFIELFLGWSFKKLLSYLKSMPSYFNAIIFEIKEFVLLQNLVQKLKKKMEPKVPDFGFLGVEINLLPRGILKPYFRLPLTVNRCTGDEVWLEFENNIIILEISTLQVFKNEFLAPSVNFGIRFAFSEFPSPDPAQLYEV